MHLNRTYSLSRFATPSETIMKHFSVQIFHSPRYLLWWIYSVIVITIINNNLAVQTVQRKTGQTLCLSIITADKELSLAEWWELPAVYYIQYAASICTIRLLNNKRHPGSTRLYTNRDDAVDSLDRLMWIIRETHTRDNILYINKGWNKKVIEPKVCVPVINQEICA